MRRLSALHDQRAGLIDQPIMLAALAQRLKVSRSVAVCLVLAGLIVRALVPAGLMPDIAAAKAGEFSLTLCTPTGLKVVSVDGAGTTEGPAGHVPARHADGACEFSGLVSAVAVPVATAHLIVPEYASASTLGMPERRRAVQRIVVAGRGARAPPFTIFA